MIVPGTTSDGLISQECPLGEEESVVDSTSNEGLSRGVDRGDLLGDVIGRSVELLNRVEEQRKVGAGSLGLKVLDQLLKNVGVLYKIQREDGIVSETHGEQSPQFCNGSMAREIGISKVIEPIDGIYEKYEKTSVWFERQWEGLN